MLAAHSVMYEEEAIRVVFLLHVQQPRVVTAVLRKNFGRASRAHAGAREYS